jgi:hypothetical protein
MAASNKLSLASGSLTATETGEAKSLPNGAKGFIAYLSATAVAISTLDVTIQHSPDKTNWYNVVSFTQLAAPGNEIKQHANFTVANMNLFPNLRAVRTLGAGATVTAEVSIWFEDDR